MLLNACVFALVAADHLLEAVSAAQQRAKAKGTAAAALGAVSNATATAAAMGARHLLQQDLGVSGSGGGAGGVLAAAAPSEMPLRSLFPPLSASVSASLDPVFRLSIFVVSLLLTLRLGRAYERWWEARRAFAALGSVALSLAQRGEAWFGGDSGGGGDRQEKEETSAAAAILPSPSSSFSPGRLLAEDLARWAVVWQFSVLQIVTDSPKLHPAARKLLRPAELALYDAAPKGRQLTLQRLTHLLTEGPALAAAAAAGGAARAAAAEINPVVVDNVLRAGSTAAGACTGIKLQVRELLEKKGGKRKRESKER